MKRPLLYPFSIIYDGITRLRNKLYDRGTFSSVEFSLPVISVGNLSVGGTGKSPHVEYLIRLLKDRYVVATLSRGYKRKTKGFYIANDDSTAATIGDEPLQFHRKFPDIIVSVGEDRLVSVPQLLTAHPEVAVILMDDAFQHRRVNPGLQILLSDYNDPFYEDYLLPAGNLRESRSGYHRADLIIVTKCPTLLTEVEMEAIRKKINPQKQQALFFSSYRYETAYDFYTGQTIQEPLPRNILLLSGIAHPQPMVAHIIRQGQEVRELHYPDHHQFSAADLSRIKTRLEELPPNDRGILTTEKDAMRLLPYKQQLKEWNLPIFLLPISVEILNNPERFDRLIYDFVEEEIAANS